MARVLLVGCGCRGQALGGALLADGHAVRGTTRSPSRVVELEAAGIEGVVANPDRLGTLVPALSGVTVVCWLMGSAAPPRARAADAGHDRVASLHGDRLASFAEHLVDTPVRGLVYEAAGSVEPTLLTRGAQIVRNASHTWHIPVEVVQADPADRSAWLEASTAAVGRLLT